jgi:hypothetical protein
MIAEVTSNQLLHTYVRSFKSQVYYLLQISHIESTYTYYGTLPVSL